MKLRTTDYALLSAYSYINRAINESVTLNGVEYKVVARDDKPGTGFQATAYDHVNADGSHELVIDYRGTEFDREPVHDGLVDAGMALIKWNPQAKNSIEFTQRVINEAKQKAEREGYALHITVTGHSLGGTLAQMNAHRFSLSGETFNAFGAAGLASGIPAGGHQVINHVRATDVVSAASPHFGEVRTYAVPSDIDALRKARYTGIPLLNQLPTHAPVLGKIQGDAHAIDNFVPDSKTLGQSLISRENLDRYDANRVMVEAYRGDIRHARTVASTLSTSALGMAAAHVAFQARAAEQLVTVTPGAGQAIRDAYRLAHTHGSDDVSPDARDYQIASAAVTSAISHPARPQPPYALAPNATDTPSVIPHPWVRQSDTGVWTRKVAEQVLEHGMVASHTETATPERAAQLDRQAAAVIAQNLANTPAAIAQRYLEAYREQGWEAQGPVPEAVTHARRTPPNVLLASDGHTYSRGPDNVWTTRGLLGRSIAADGPVRAELDATQALKASGSAREPLAVPPPSIDAPRTEPSKPESARAEAKPGDPNTFEARLDRMLAAARTDDWTAFRHETQAFAALQPAKDLHAYAVTTVNMQEQMATQHQVQMQAMQQQMQDAMQQSSRPQGFSPSR
jgi:hypothetical protein